MITGRLHPYLPELSIRDYNTYLRYSRGVSYQLYLDYGLFSYGILPHKGSGALALLTKRYPEATIVCNGCR